jgi:hypothetical protein
VCLSIPDHVTPDTRTAPSPDEVRPWVEAVLQLWDDRTAYDASASAARASAGAWHPDAVVPRWELFLDSLRQAR